MVRAFVVAFALSWLGAAALAQIAQNPPALATTGRPGAERGIRKTEADAALRGRPQRGACQLGLISIVGNKFWIRDLGPMQFQHELRWARADWDLDNLVFASVRAAAPGIAVRKIDYDKKELLRGAQNRGFFDRLFYSLASDVRDFARTVASGTPCDRYIVVHRHYYPIDGRRESAAGIGVVRIHQPFASDRAYLYAVTYIRTYDGASFELLEEAAAATDHDGGPLDFSRPEPFRGPKREIDVASFPTSTEQAASSPMFRATIRSLLTASLDQTPPKVLRPNLKETSQ